MSVAEDTQALVLNERHSAGRQRGEAEIQDIQVQALQVRKITFNV
jgi:hypothetical protein